MPDQAITMSTVTLVGSVLTLALLGVGTLIGVVRWLDGRREASVKALYDRIDRVQNECVRREEYHEDRRRLDDRLNGLANAMSVGFDKIATRIDAIFARRGGD